MSPLAMLRGALPGAVLLLMVGCAPQPVIVCDNLRPVRPEALDCREALAVAITALPFGDEPTRAEFQYGTYCAMSSGCGFSGPGNRVDFGYAIFSYAGTTRHEYVSIAADANGRPRLAGTLSSSPPPFMWEPPSP
jgi:hypothetical protein